MPILHRGPTKAVPTCSKWGTFQVFCFVSPTPTTAPKSGAMSLQVRLSYLACVPDPLPAVPPEPCPLNTESGQVGRRTGACGCGCEPRGHRICDTPGRCCVECRSLSRYLENMTENESKTLGKGESLMPEAGWRRWASVPRPARWGGT